MSCNNNNNPCKDLGCLYPSNTDCVWLKGIDTNCLGIKDKDLLTDALNTLISEVCSLSPSGIPNNVVVNNSDGNLIVTDATVGNTTTYTVNLNSAITTDITNLQINVAALTACCSNTITGADLIGGTDIGITDNGDGTFTIDYIGTPTTVYNGILYNNVVPVDGTGVVNNLPELLKQYGIDFFSVSNISSGDEIRFVANGQLTSDNTYNPSTIDDVVIDLFNNANATVVSTTTFSSFNAGRFSYPTVYNSWEVEGVLTVNNPGTPGNFDGDGLLTLKLSSVSKANGIQSGSTVQEFKINQTINNIDFGSLTFRVFYVRNTTANPGLNYAQKLMVEVRKAI